MADIAVPFKARAPRRTNLQKPLPRSKSVTEETVSSPTEEPKTPTEEPQTRTEDVTAPVFKASAPRRVNLKKPLPRSKSVTEEVHHTIDTSTSTNTNKHRLKSQMSVDSGVEVGDSNNNNNSSGNIYVGRNNSINEVLPDEGFNEYPEDILMIEEELSSLVIDDIVTQSEPCRLIVLREPISPTTLGHVDTESGGLLTPSGRRRMFCLHRNSMHNKKAQPRECIQYTADELLEIGASTQSKQTPESWAYLVHILPGICLSKVSAYFDTVTYQQERGYVVECCYVRKSHSNNNDDNNNDNVRHFDNRNDKQQNTARWTVPTNFFGSHSSNNNNDDNNNVRHFEHRNGKQQNSGRWTVPTNFPPVRNGFGRPNRTEEVLTEEV